MPDDALALRQWRRGVCVFYAALYLILAAIWSLHQAGTAEDGNEAAGVTTPAAETGRSEHLSPVASCITRCGD